MPFDFSQDAYISLRNLISERTGSIVAWVGSGLSIPAGLPNWNSLRKRLTDVLENKAKTYSEIERKKTASKIANIKAQKNNWIAFEMLLSEVGATTYRETIKEELRPALTADIPKLYANLWEIKIRGLLNLNLDGLATRAFREASTKKKQLAEFVGTNAPNMMHVLRSPHPFIANLHGVADDASTWVLTHRDLKAIRENLGYVQFINTCAISNTFLFLGISADDQAVGGYLETITKSGISCGPHYWITNRCDVSTDQWAECNGVRIIRYSPSDDGHAVLGSVFDDLRSFFPQEESVQPVLLAKEFNYDPSDLPSVGELLSLPSDDIRDLLNAHAKQLLANESEEAYKEYERFCTEYDEVIYRAWYTSAESGKNSLFDNELLEVIGRGAFGKVYKAKNKEGNIIAVKVLLEEIRRDKELLSSFRRGVRSMRILHEHNIKGMVSYNDASEIPAFVAMEFINGPDLRSAIQSRQICEWDEILKVASDLAQVILSAHRLPERVLHRDIRPTNVMLKDFYATSGEIDVVVLDFDLSWHRDACEKSVTHGSSGLGYLAPEQMMPIRGVSTRHASVDSFGLGMTLYFMVSGLDPIPENHKHVNWIENVRLSASRIRCEAWESTPYRFSRLICNATQNDQSSRWDVAQIVLELSRLYEAVKNPSSVSYSELIAEEIAVRTSYSKAYVWDEDSSSAFINLPSGISIKIGASESLQEISMKIMWMRGEFRERNIIKWVTKAKDTISSILIGGKWKIYSSDCTQDKIEFFCKMNREQAIASVDRVSATLDSAIKVLSPV